MALGEADSGSEQPDQEQPAVSIRYSVEVGAAFGTTDHNDTGSMPSCMVLFVAEDRA